ncbi:hypothetical protein [Minwuia thermotolerans]|uniref:hypothetical protein n=1 Tax=Minwuia thermotolerans TaxID=2056226 RepID=UPI000F63EF64|nr:hypothetical protein [Minwuia thermotolerans]
MRHALLAIPAAVLIAGAAGAAETTDPDDGLDNITTSDVKQDYDIAGDGAAAELGRAVSTPGAVEETTGPLGDAVDPGERPNAPTEEGSVITPDELAGSAEEMREMDAYFDGVGEEKVRTQGAE